MTSFCTSLNALFVVDAGFTVSEWPVPRGVVLGWSSAAGAKLSAVYW